MRSLLERQPISSCLVLEQNEMDLSRASHCPPSPFSKEPWKAGPGYSPLPSPPPPHPSLPCAAWKLTHIPVDPSSQDPLCSGFRLGSSEGQRWQKTKRQKKREARCFVSISSLTQDLIAHRDISPPSCSSCQVAHPPRPQSSRGFRNLISLCLTPAAYRG